MSRMIDADALINRIDKIIETNHLDSQMVWFTPSGAKLLVDEQPTIEPEQRWIPCSERLPEKHGRYLTTNSEWGAWIVDWNIWCNDPKPSWLWEQGVIAWMPLPEPYKEDEE